MDSMLYCEILEERDIFLDTVSKLLKQGPVEACDGKNQINFVFGIEPHKQYLTIL